MMYFMFEFNFFAVLLQLMGLLTNLGAVSLKTLLMTKFFLKQKNKSKKRELRSRNVTPTQISNK